MKTTIRIQTRRSSIQFSKRFISSMNLVHFDFRISFMSLTLAVALFIFSVSAACFAALIGLFNEDDAFSNEIE